MVPECFGARGWIASKQTLTSMSTSGRWVRDSNGGRLLCAPSGGSEAAKAHRPRRPRPLMPIKAFWDIGVSDATAIWIAQFVGRSILVLDYYGQKTSRSGLISNGFGPAGTKRLNASCPLAGDRRDAVTAIRFEDHIRAAGFKVRTIRNQGKGAAMKRVEAMRRVFPAMWFNEQTTTRG